MNDDATALDFERGAMARSAMLARLEGELDELKATLARLPLWEPAREIGAELAWVHGQLARLAEAWDRSLVVAIVGPSGAGKSTLLNALAGRALSPVGLERPTTRKVIAFVPSSGDADWLTTLLGEENLQVEIAPEAPGLAHLILLDTPDTNTLQENRALLARALEHVDLALAVFDAGNPRLLDNLAFLAPAMRRLPPEVIVPVLNRVDRVTEAALDGELVPDLRGALLSEWGIRADRIYQISARVALEGPGQTDDERPLHGRNQFAELRDSVLARLGRSGEGALRRGAHAERLVALLREDVAARLGDAARRAEARARLIELDGRAQQAVARQVLANLDRGAASWLAEGLYERLARRWWGPVGWLLTLWALALRAIGWLRQATHRGLRWPGATVTGRPSTSDAPGSDLMAAQVSVYAAAWPPLADSLVELGFAPRVRQAEQWRAQAAAIERAVSVGGQEAVESALDSLARRLSLWLWQVLLNGPVIVLTVWVGVVSVMGLFTEQYRSADFYRQAGIAGLVVWLGAFVLLQLIAGTSLRRPLERRIERELAEAAPPLEAGDLLSQLEALDALAQSSGGRRRRH